MTQEDATVTLDELRALEAKATPGPWTLCPDLSGCDCGHGTQSIDALEGNLVVAEFRDLTDPADEHESNNTAPIEGRRANAAFIVAAVQYVRDALSVEGREAQIERIAAVLDAADTNPLGAGYGVTPTALYDAGLRVRPSETPR